MNAASVDGLAQRFIPVVLHGEETKMWQPPVPEFLSVRPEYEHMIRTVFATKPSDYDCSPEAVGIFRRYGEWYLKGREIDTILRSNDVFMTAVGKSEGTCLRIALLIHLMKSPDCLTISADTMLQAVNIMQQFVIPSLRHTFMEIVGMKDELGVWVTEHIVQLSSVRPTISLSELRRSAKQQLLDRTTHQADTDLRVIMEDLADSGYVSVMSDFGRSVVWSINPTVATIYKDHRKQIIEAKQNSIEHIRQSIAKHHTIKPNTPNAIGWVEEMSSAPTVTNSQELNKVEPTVNKVEETVETVDAGYRVDHRAVLRENSPAVA
jgi:hypothetical protein